MKGLQFSNSSRNYFSASTYLQNWSRFLFLLSNSRRLIENSAYKGVSTIIRSIVKKNVDFCPYIFLRYCTVGYDTLLLNGMKVLRSIPHDPPPHPYTSRVDSQCTTDKSSLLLYFQKISPTIFLFETRTSCLSLDECGEGGGMGCLYQRRTRNKSIAMLFLHLC